jgi:hypothetical protein
MSICKNCSNEQSNDANDGNIICCICQTEVVSKIGPIKIKS